MAIKLAYPIRPLHVNQKFGANRDYYKTRFATNGHMGIDYQAEHGHPVYAAHDGMAQFIKDDHGGEGIYIYDYENGFKTVYWHLCGDTDPKFPSPIRTDFKVYPVKKGDLIGYADNSGAPFESSGDHLHFALYRIDKNGVVLNNDNGFNGAIDPQPYFDGLFAEPNTPDLAKQIDELTGALSKYDPTSPTAYQQKSLLQQAVELIKAEIASLFT